MVTANVDIPDAEGPAPAGRHGGGGGSPSQGKGQGPPGRLPLPRRGGGQLHGVRRLPEVLVLRLRVSAATCWTSSSRPRGCRCPMPSRGWTAALGLRPGPPFVQPERGVLRPPRCLPRDPTLLTAAARFYAGRLRRSTEAREYLASRGVGPVAAARLGLGYAPGGGLRLALESCGFPEKRIQDSGLFMERGAERFAGMVVVPDPVSSTGQALSGGLVRWLVGRAIDPDRTPRFQAPPGPKPVLGLGRLGPSPPWAVVAEGVFDWLALTGWGLPACRCPGHPGRGADRLGPPGLPPRLPRLRQRRRGARGDGRASDPARTQGRRRRPSRRHRRRGRACGPSPGPRPLPPPALAGRPLRPLAALRRSPAGFPSPPFPLTEPVPLRFPDPQSHFPGGPMPNSRRAPPAHGFP